jgi:NADPH-dependent 2,4-dienoyl-CoA reductase/sulfur reductase-like enzyme
MVKRSILTLAFRGCQYGAAATASWSLRDCRRILANVISGARVAVAGGSFIAMESAASLFGRGLSVDVIAPEKHPLEKVFSRELSDLILERSLRLAVLSLAVLA